jgi:hypothetical protein
MMPQKAALALSVRELLDLLNTVPLESRDVQVMLWEECRRCYRPLRTVRICQVDGNGEVQAQIRISAPCALIGLF